MDVVLTLSLILFHYIQYVPIKFKKMAIAIVIVHWWIDCDPSKNYCDASISPREQIITGVSSRNTDLLCWIWHLSSESVSFFITRGPVKRSICSWLCKNLAKVCMIFCFDIHSNFYQPTTSQITSVSPLSPIAALQPLCHNRVMLGNHGNSWMIYVVHGISRSDVFGFRRGSNIFHHPGNIVFGLNESHGNPHRWFRRFWKLIAIRRHYMNSIAFKTVTRSIMQRKPGHLSQNRVFRQVISITHQSIPRHSCTCMFLFGKIIDIDFWETKYVYRNKIYRYIHIINGCY